MKKFIKKPFRSNFLLDAVIILALVFLQSSCASDQSSTKSETASKPRADYSKPWICDCTNKSVPVNCHTQTEHLKMDFTIEDSDKQGRFVLVGTAVNIGKKPLRRFLAPYENDNRFFLYLYLNGHIVKKKLLNIKSDRYSEALKLKGDIEAIDFDAASIGYSIYVRY